LKENLKENLKEKRVIDSDEARVNVRTVEIESRSRPVISTIVAHDGARHNAATVHKGNR